MRRGTIDEVEAQIQDEDIEPGPAIESLITQDLASFAIDEENAGDIQPSWLGFGVFNWERHLRMHDIGETPSKPRQGENGHSRPPGRGEACDSYRPVAFRPGYCWCCAIRGQHHGRAAAVQAAESILRQARAKNNAG